MANDGHQAPKPLGNSTKPAAFPAAEPNVAGANSIGDALAASVKAAAASFPALPLTTAADHSTAVAVSAAVSAAVVAAVSSALTAVFSASGPNARREADPLASDLHTADNHRDKNPARQIPHESSIGAGKRPARQFGNVEVFIKDNAEATQLLKAAEQESPSPNGKMNFFFAVDGSFNNGVGGYCVVWKRADLHEPDGVWIARAWKISKCVDSCQCELMGIVEALGTAADYVQRLGVNAQRGFIRVFSDSMPALNHVKRVQNGQPTPNGLWNSAVGNPILEELARTCQLLDERYSYRIELHWVPRNCSISHIWADKWAGEARSGVFPVGVGQPRSEATRRLDGKVFLPAGPSTKGQIPAGQSTKGQIPTGPSSKGQKRERESNAPEPPRKKAKVKKENIQEEPTRRSTRLAKPVPKDAVGQQKLVDGIPNLRGGLSVMPEPITKTRGTSSVEAFSDVTNPSTSSFGTSSNTFAPSPFAFGASSGTAGPSLFGFGASSGATPAPTFTFGASSASSQALSLQARPNTKANSSMALIGRSTWPTSATIPNLPSQSVPQLKPDMAYSSVSPAGNVQAVTSQNAVIMEEKPQVTATEVVMRPASNEAAIVSLEAPVKMEVDAAANGIPMTAKSTEPIATDAHPNVDECTSIAFQSTHHVLVAGTDASGAIEPKAREDARPVAKDVPMAATNPTLDLVAEVRPEAVTNVTAQQPKELPASSVVQAPLGLKGKVAMEPNP
ncbi:hypothetical protein B0T16DRAFT_498379 [Cercophora newfieldiana]|uniref:RNase H type-1 domain-containing protein n=1 Tax=Cercophora newfieldiana TaxID=92897 RepID=A0AA39YLY3_9PEZI|nr:hypothetical protein B0T16DRAFT_498379 [Cercophora newfieldiana]